MNSGPEDCIFCKIVRGELPVAKLAEDELTVSFMDINPATRGHALVVPRTHSEDLLSVSAEDLEAVVRAPSGWPGASGRGSGRTE